MKYLCLIGLLFVAPFIFGNELRPIEALEGRITLLAPSHFEPMSKELVEFKYPSASRPTEVLSDDTGGVTLAFNYTNNPMTPPQIREAHPQFSTMFHNLYPSATWLRDEIIQQGGRNFIVMELITPAIDTQIHKGTSIN